MGIQDQQITKEVQCNIKKLKKKYTYTIFMQCNIKKWSRTHIVKKQLYWLAKVPYKYTLPHIMTISNFRGAKKKQYFIISPQIFYLNQSSSSGKLRKLIIRAYSQWKCFTFIISLISLPNHIHNSSPKTKIRSSKLRYDSSIYLPQYLSTVSCSHPGGSGTSLHFAHISSQYCFSCLV